MSPARPRRRRPSRRRRGGRRRPPAKDASKQRGAAPRLLSVDQIAERLEAALARSPADETELVWLELTRGSGGRRRGSAAADLVLERTLLVRVLDLGRVGSFRTSVTEPGEILDAIRFAMAQSRVREPLSGLPHLPLDGPLDGPPDGSSNEPTIGPASGSVAGAPAGRRAGDEKGTPEATPILFDRKLAAMSAGDMAGWLERLPNPKPGVDLRVRWTRANVVVSSSRGIRRQAETTALGLRAQSGREPGRSRAVDAVRHLDRLDPGALIERAIELATETVADLPKGPVPVVLSPEATVQLVSLLSDTAFSAKSYYDGTSFLREHINVQVFDRRFHLRDDGTDLDGLPFPFDLEGTFKHSVDLIRNGAPKTPTLDQRQAAVLGLPPTAHAIGGNNARAENLVLEPGEFNFEELLGLAEGGLWIGWFDALEGLDPRRVAFHARARGVRRIQDGKLGPATPSFVWRDGLLRAFSAIAGVGDTATRVLGADGYLGGISAPALVVSGVTPWVEGGGS